jgi:hypothetical protein
MKGYHIDVLAGEIERHRGTSTSLGYVPPKVHLPKLKSIMCENCGATLEVGKHPSPYRCPECRRMAFPCDRCPDNCSKAICRHNDGMYVEEATSVKRGGEYV